MPREKGWSRAKRVKPSRSAGKRKAAVAKGPRTSGDSDVEAQERQIALRTLGFAAIVVLLSAVALLFVVSALKNSRGDGQVSISVPATVQQYTVKVLQEPPGHREALEALARRPELRALAGEHGFFLCRLPNGGAALCAGRFASKDTSEARALLARFQNYTLNGRWVFESAMLWGFSPGGAENLR